MYVFIDFNLYVYVCVFMFVYGHMFMDTYRGKKRASETLEHPRLKITVTWLLTVGKYLSLLQLVYHPVVDFFAVQKITFQLKKVKLLFNFK